MYCPSCGDQFTQGLNYCKRCGVNLSAPAEPSMKKFPSAITALFLLIIGALSITGLGVPLMLAHELTRDFSARGVMLIMFGCWFVTLLIDYMLVTLLMRLAGPSQLNPVAKRNLVMPRLDRSPLQVPPPEPAVSVTENTTRSFEPRRYDDSRA